MRHRLFKKRLFYFSNLFIRITGLIFVLTIILSTFLYFTFQDSGTRIINTSNEKLLKSISTNAIQLDEYIRIFSTNLLNDEKSQSLLYGFSNTLSTDTRNILHINNISINTPFLNSIYLYNAKRDSYFVAGKNSSINNSKAFFDKDIINILSK